MASDYTPTNVTSGFEMEVAINQNFNEIKTAIDKLLNRSVSGNNSMSQTLDMGGFTVLNLPKPIEPTHPVRLTDVDSLAIPDVIVTPTSGPTYSIDATTATIVKITLDQNAVITITGTPNDGQVLLFLLKQDAVGSRTVTFSANVRTSDDLNFAQSTGANKLDYVMFRFNATDSKFDLLALNKGF